MIMSSPTLPSYMPYLVLTNLDLIEHNIINLKNFPLSLLDKDL